MTKVIRYTGDENVVIEEWLNETKERLLATQIHLLPEADKIIELADDVVVSPMFYTYDADSGTFIAKSKSTMMSQRLISTTIDVDVEKSLIHRNKLLQDSDWVVIRSFETGEPVPAEWIAYRKALRDITINFTDPADVVWPTPPTINDSLAKYNDFVESVKDGTAVDPNNKGT